MKEDIRPEVLAFAHAMELTLRKHDHKGGWMEMSLGELLDRVDDELKEAQEAWDAIKKQEDYYRVSEELIDVANFCMMFWEQMELTKIDSLLDTVKKEKIITMTEDEFDMIAKNTFDNEYTQELIENIRFRRM